MTAHEAVTAMVAQVVQEWVLGRCAGRECRRRSWLAHTKASTLDPALLELVVSMNLFGTIHSCNAVAPVMKQQRPGKLGGWQRHLPRMAAMPITGQRRQLSPITRGIWAQISGRSGSRQTVSPRRDRHRADHAEDGHSGQQPGQSRSSRFGRPSAARERSRIARRSSSSLPPTCPTV